MNAESIKKKIEKDFKDKDEQKLENYFDKFKKDKRGRAEKFIKYYNKTVLNKERIKFSEFKHQWAIQGMTKEVYGYFDRNLDRLKEKIIKEKNIKSFFNKHCTRKRKEVSFCSKLFHTFLPDEFPPFDSGIIRHFKLKRDIDGVLMLKKGYKLFIKENPKIIKLLRKTLLKNKFSYLRIKELSDMRVLDMYIWFKEKREQINPIQ